MNESFETGKTPDAYLAEAIAGNGEFLTALSEVQDLQQLKHLIHEFAFVQDGESFVFEIIEQPGEDIDAVTYLEDDLVHAINLFTDGTPVERSEVLGMVAHTKIAEAVIRITGAQ